MSWQRLSGPQLGRHVKTTSEHIRYVIGVNETLMVFSSSIAAPYDPSRCAERLQHIVNARELHLEEALRHSLEPNCLLTPFPLCTISP